MWSQWIDTSCDELDREITGLQSVLTADEFGRLMSRWEYLLDALDAARVEGLTEVKGQSND